MPTILIFKLRARFAWARCEAADVFSWPVRKEDLAFWTVERLHIPCGDNKNAICPCEVGSDNNRKAIGAPFNVLNRIIFIAQSLACGAHPRSSKAGIGSAVPPPNATSTLYLMSGFDPKRTCQHFRQISNKDRIMVSARFAKQTGSRSALSAGAVEPIHRQISLRPSHYRRL